MNKTELDISIVMPCLNEVKTLEQCIARAQEALATLRDDHGLTGEIVIADNGSTDGSQALASRLGARVLDVADKGYGAALKGGFAGAYGRYLVMGDSDCSYDFAECVPMIEKLQGGADICMGSRFAGQIKPGAMPWKNKYIGNPALSWILRLLYSTHVHDAHCGLRALTRKCYQRLDLQSDGMDFASEMILKAALLGEKIDEVPVTLWPDGRGRPPHLNPWRDGWRHLRLMLLLSPVWLFVVPALMFGAVGLLLFAALLAQPSGTMVDIGPAEIGDHWLPIASASVVISVQLLMFGCIGVLHSYTTGIRPVTHGAKRLLDLFRLEYVMILGTAIFLAGFAIIGTIAVGWLGTGSQALNALREMIAGTTLIVVGAQTFFAGFLIAIIGGSKSRIALAPRATAQPAEQIPAE